MEEILNFLIEAKKNTYANGNALKAASSRQGSNDYHYEGVVNNKKAIYHDTYFGGEQFMGEEVVYLDSSKPIWGMNYYGNTIEKELSEEAMDNALRPALMQVGVDKSVLPLRGPSEFINGEYRYTFKHTGTMQNFIGLERIYKNDKLIFELKCFGGIIK